MLPKTFYYNSLLSIFFINRAGAPPPQLIRGNTLCHNRTGSNNSAFPYCDIITNNGSRANKCVCANMYITKTKPCSFLLSIIPWFQIVGIDNRSLRNHRPFIDCNQIGMNIIKTNTFTYITILSHNTKTSTFRQFISQRSADWQPIKDKLSYKFVHDAFYRMIFMFRHVNTD